LLSKVGHPTIVAPSLDSVKPGGTLCLDSVKAEMRPATREHAREHP
jgi:hypothetical protein